MKYVVFLAVALGTVLLFLLSRASSNTAAFSQNYTLLLVLNLGVARIADGVDRLPAMGAVEEAQGARVRHQADAAHAVDVCSHGGAAGHAGVWRVGAVPQQEHRILV